KKAQCHWQWASVSGTRMVTRGGAWAAPSGNRSMDGWAEQGAHVYTRNQSCAGQIRDQGTRGHTTALDLERL
ncbi:MAG: hypothetical protein ACK2VA_16420, partial [Anaerolineae bacterium]